MNINEIEIHAGEPSFAYRAVRQLEAKVEAVTNFSAAPTINDANAKLREMAVQVGANAVIRVDYKTGISMTSWHSMTATGLAVVREADELPCPSCAEMVKRAARKCRFCGQALDFPEPAPRGIGAQNAADIPAEPLRATNNSTVPYWIATGIVVFLFIMLLASS